MLRSTEHHAANSGLHGFADVLVGQFELAWSQNERPSLALYAAMASPADQPDLLAKLIPVDIRHRIELGETPRLRDYGRLGKKATVVARKHFGESDQPEDGQADAVEDQAMSFTVDESSTSMFGDTGDRPTGDTDFSWVEQPSDFIGPYKLLEQIGQGGMGSVWMAEQQEPVRRKVALKVIRSGLGSVSMMARFEAERQAIAMMDHQNIARILDAGTTERGCPYYVMELVNGIPLNKFCDQNKLTIRQRLELMIPVCMAIQHAHQKGIIHRDLKHSNVMVTQYDGKPVPKVIDFGLAKSLTDQNRLTDKTMFTEFGKVVGTLQYMSPEQAALDGMDVDTRSDIYSLGIMIYKLLTGNTPLVNDVVSSHSLVQVLQLIRDQEPPRPSGRLRSHGAENADQIADLRRTTPEKLEQTVRGDLDWIVIKTLEKDRNRRYETANGLALDLQRYLNHEPIRARPPSTVYRIGKFVRRNRRLAASLVLSTTLLIAGIIGTSAGMIWALDERNRANEKSVEAEQQRQEAERQTEIARTAESDARDAERERRKLQLTAETRLHAVRIKSAWSDWLLGNVESAWQMLNEQNESLMGWESYFVRTEFSNSQDTLYGQGRKVVDIDVSADGKWIATAATDHTVIIRQAVNKQRVHRFLVPDLPTCVRFSPDSQWVACANRANKVSVWNMNTGQLQTELGPWQRDIFSIAFSSDSQRLYLGEAASDSFREANVHNTRHQGKPLIHVVDLESREVLAELTGHEKDITGIVTSADGKLLVTAAMDSTIRVWDIEDAKSYRLKHLLDKHTMGVQGVSITTDGQLIASCSDDMTARIWNAESGQPVSTIVGHTEPLHDVRFSADGKRLVTASTDRTARVWDLTGQQQLLLQGHFETVNAAAFTSDQKQVLTVADDMTVKVWSAEGKRGTKVIRGHKDVAWCCDFSTDGNILASVSEDGTVTFVDLQHGWILGDKIPHDNAMLSVAFSPNSRTDFVAVGGADATIRIYRAQDGKLLKSFKAHQDFIWDVQFSPDGKLLASGGSDKAVNIWNTEDWSLVKSLTRHDSELASVRFSSDGKYLLTGSDDRTIMLWDAHTFQHLRTFQGHQHSVWRAIFSPDNRLIASSSSGGEIILWDVQSGTQKWAIKAHSDQVAGLAFTSDGTRIVSASDDQTIKILDVQSGIEMFVLRDRDDSAIAHVSFSDDGSKMVSGNAEGWITIRSAERNTDSLDLFLPNDAVELGIEGLRMVTSGEATIDDYRQELANAEKCCQHYPTYRAWTIRGICLYRLGRFDESIAALQEAARLEPIEYGEPDVRPDIEGYLAMACLNADDSEGAAVVRNIFDQKSQTRLWQDDELVQALRSEVLKEFGDTTESSPKPDADSQ